MPSNKHPNAREHLAMGIPADDDAADAERDRRDADLLALARLPEGRRVLAWLMFRDRAVYFCGGGADAYNLGRRSVGEELETHLKGILPRELHLDVIYPKEGVE